jgi:putative hydrolase of the HAD superfamily
VTIEGVVFDWGGTLSIYAGVELADMWVLAARHLAPDREDEVTAALARVEAETWARVEVDQQSTTLASILRTASIELGLDVAEAVLEEAATHHLDSWTPHIEHDDDAVAVLTELKRRGLRLGLLSNTHWPRAFHDRFLERDGLLDLLDARCYTSEMSHTKPHRAAFETVLLELGLSDPGAVVFVGDRPYDDIAGAKAMGMKAVLRPNALVPDHPVEPDATIGALPELLALIDDWSA